MPKRTARRPKIPAQASKLRPEQLLQVAAIEEIEAILNADIRTAGLTEVVTGVPERPAKKRPRLTVGAAAASPYVVDLKQAAASNVPAQPAARTPWRLRRQERRLAAQAPVPLAPLAPQLSAKAAAAGERLAAYARPWRRVEPYTHELAVLWLVRLAFTLATLPFRVAFYLLQSVWEVAGGFERLAAAEIALRVSLRGFFIAGSVVTHALGSAGHEVATEVADMVRRSAWSIGRRLRTLFRRSARRGVRAGEAALGTVDTAVHSAVEQARSAPERMVAMAEHADLPLQRYMPWALIRRRVAAFVVIAALVITPLKLAGYFETVGEVRGVVLGESETAIGHLQAALTSGQALAFTDAAQDFGSAAAAFADAREGLAAYAGAINVAEWVPLQQTKSAKAVERLLRSGEAAATGASHLSLAIDALELVDPEGEGAAVPAPLTERIKEFRREAMAAQQAMQMLRQEITALDPEVVAGLPAPQAAAVAEQVALMRHNADLLTEGLDEVVAVAAFFEEFLGDVHDTRYLLVFQNNAEMRASGGFIGSFALADFRQGTLKNLEVPAGGSYDLQGGLHTRVSAPEPLHLINSLWEFQDANWWPDWPTSAKKLEWFFVNGWGSSVDGVIAVTPDVIEDVLRVIGPVDMTADYGVTVTAENFYEVAQSRENLADANEPKAIIRDLTAAIIEEFPARLSWEKLVALAGVVHENLNGKQVLMAFDDPDLQAFADERNWSGRVAEAPRDYLMVVNTNIAGAKSDRAVRQHIKHEAAVTPDGGITVTVTVTRKHTAERGAAFSGVRNVDYMRLYVPKGSQLVSAHGFLAPEAIYFDEPAPGATADPDLAAEAEADIDEASGVRVYSEAGKTVFGHWSQVDPGEEVEIVLTYKLPFKLNEFTQEPNAWERIIGQRDVSDYSLLLQKQAGDTNTTYESSLKLSGGREVVWPKPAAADGMFVDGWQLQGELDRDRYWGIVIEKK